MGEALVFTKGVKDFISSHKTLQMFMYTQLTIQNRIHVWSAETFCQHTLTI